MKAWKSYPSSLAFYRDLALIVIIFSTARGVLLDGIRVGEPHSSSPGLIRRATKETEPIPDPTQTLAHPLLLTNSQENNARDACRPRTLSPTLWSKLNLNQYLLEYPGGQQTSLEELAVKSKLLNFDCGINKLCYAGQVS